MAKRSKAALAKDRKYTSEQSHEKRYAKKRKSPVVKYKKAAPVAAKKKAK